jgi:hypothetical protein
MEPRELCSSGFCQRRRAWQLDESGQLLCIELLAEVLDDAAHKVDSIGGGCTAGRRHALAQLSNHQVQEALEVEGLDVVIDCRVWLYRVQGGRR